MTELKALPLTPEERAHVNRGGRVFGVDEAPSGLWRVLSVSGKGCKVLLKPDDADGYIEREEAVDNARAIAALAADKPMVRP
jgi:hypothetical protein